MIDKIILWNPQAPEHDSDPEPEQTNGLDLALINDIEFDDVDMDDYPDFADAYISAATYDGVEMTDDELAELNEKHPGFVYERLISKLF
jgi:TRAP-type uncharacterized transport system substrate-binding protein